FFQAEDGIRDFHVTGVQTCALPILPAAEERDHERDRRVAHSVAKLGEVREERHAAVRELVLLLRLAPFVGDCARWLNHASAWAQIGRASCRDRVYIAGVAGPPTESL